MRRGGSDKVEAIKKSLNWQVDGVKVEELYRDVHGLTAGARTVVGDIDGGAASSVAEGIVEALKIRGEGASKPLVVRLDGNNVVEGRRILDEANHPLVTQVDTMDNAADKAAELAAAGISGAGV